jgi:CheY-like chemotaxis protein
MSGLEFLKEFQKNKTLSKIPIMMSTVCVREQKKSCAALGAVNFISKPNSWKETLDTAKNILDIEDIYS